MISKTIDLMDLAQLSKAVYEPFYGGEFVRQVRRAGSDWRVSRTWDFADGVEAFAGINAYDALNHQDEIRTGGPLHLLKPGSHRPPVQAKRMLISIRGTELSSRSDRIRDCWGSWQRRKNFKLSDRLQKYSKLYAHAGFCDGGDQLAGNLMSHANNYGAKKLIITGHSAGGAIGACMVPQLLASGFEVLLVTFGCPMIGNKEFCQSFAGHTNYRGIRVVNCTDVVTRLKIQKLHGYMTGTPWHHHPGDLYYLDMDGVLRQNPSTAFVASQVLYSLFSWRGASLKDHAIDRYITQSNGYSILTGD